ncbi:Syntaxin-10 [Coemansia spiralis]|uniref:Syntaxin-10 n=2 Tax=Coemansia TaxID=4863 RepID=A0A9W8KZS1_9FUNG|nr:t-SNARE [Coemansia spiralis]KAJ1990583.1 Syntaxin-10 [Coemansia umbellata]KAJ2624917.1 Syntaxin-10 [Coemansia sp. RSA 1358]KAJ2679175.1 Syntaxin-10 [Coemansia spiralis]
MSDPFVIVQDDVVSAFEQARTLFASWKRLNGKRRSPQDENEFQFTTDEIYSTLTSVGSDLDDLQETIDVARNDPDGYGLSAAKISERQEFVAGKRKAINDMHSFLAHSSDTPVNSRNEETASRTRESQNNYADVEFGGHQQQHQVLMEEQDQHFDAMLGTVRNLHGIASTMNTELDGQAILLDEVGSLVDRTQSKLSSAKKKVDKFLRDKSNRSLHIVLILFVVILVLIMLIIFT